MLIINKKNIYKGIPYILFYKRKKEKKEDNNIFNINNIFDNVKSYEDSKEVIIPKKKKRNNINNIVNNSNEIHSDNIEDKKSINTNSKEDKINTNKNNTLNLKNSKNRNLFPLTYKDSNSFLSENIIKNKGSSRINSDIILNNSYSENSKRNNSKNNINGIKLIDNNPIIVNEIKDIKNNIIISSSKNQVIKKSVINNSINNKLSINKSISSSYNEGQNVITIYFKFIDNGNVFFIDIDEKMTFEKITNALKRRFEWINIENKYLYFNDIKIENNVSPKDIGIEDGGYIDVSSSLIDEKSQ